MVGDGVVSAMPTLKKVHKVKNIAHLIFMTHRINLLDLKFKPLKLMVMILMFFYSMFTYTLMQIYVQRVTSCYNAELFVGYHRTEILVRFYFYKIDIDD